MYAGRYIPPASRHIPASGHNDAPSAASGPAPKKIVFNVDESPVTASVAAPKKTVLADEDADGSPRKRKRNEENDDEVEDRKKDKKSKKSKRGVEDEDEAETLNKGKKPKKDTSRDNDEASDEASKVKPKKEKKKKTRESIAEADGEGDESMLVDGEENNDDEAEAKPKRDKKKKKKSKEEEPEDDISDKVKKQHKSVLERKEKALKKAKKSKTEVEADGTAETEQAPEPDELHGLEPLPQPEPIVLDHHRAGYETLPPWLASPIRVQPKTKATWTDLGIGAEAAKVMANKGYKEAFAVQTAAIPLLLPSLDRQGDLVVSAATGSGKTLAYVLPMVHDISQGIVTRLRGLIVVPTRELVRQAQEACETCASAFAHGGNKRVKIGISMGSMAFKQEQAALMEEEQKYDPAGHRKYLSKRNQIVNLDDSDDEDEVKPAMESTTKPLPDHVIDYVSKVDILICTPGRLVEHINQTPGFTLDYVRWLVVDEADKLLAQSFQQWLGVVMDRLSVEKPGARDFSKSNKSGVRKVILSATMTRDLSLLNGLKLRRPKLIVLEGTGAENHEHSTGPEGEHVLPDTLNESVIKIRDPNLKPLYLLDLLDSKHMIPMNKETEADANPEDSESEASESESESESDSDSDTESKPNPASMPSSSLNTTLLIFTKSNESALRLSRLLAILSPSLSPLIGVLTSTTRTATRRRTLGAFTKRKIRILVASDLVARGIDLPDLDHVVNYDVPASAAAYVHRVGRTARAGRKGAAWTLVGNTEAAWFFREIGGEGKSEGKVRRVGKVERIRVGDQGEDGFGEERVKEYEAALEQLGKEAGEMRRRR